MYICLLRWNQISVNGRVLKAVFPRNTIIIPFLSVDSGFYSFGAFVFMFIINFAIALKFIRAKCNGSNSSESTNQAFVKSATRGDSHDSHCFRYVFSSHSSNFCELCFTNNGILLLSVILCMGYL